MDMDTDMIMLIMLDTRQHAYEEMEIETRCTKCTIHETTHIGWLEQLDYEITWILLIMLNITKQEYGNAAERL